MIQESLPIAQHLTTIASELRSNNVILTAAPGAGKSTLLLRYLLLNFALEGKIIVLQPRRVVVRALAAYIAGSLGEEVGQRVGYQIKGERKVSAQTRLEFITEGILARRLQADPELSGTALIVFDEFHERSIHSDFGLALAIEVQQALREDLRLLIMSATLSTASLKPILPDATHIGVEGRQFPIEYHYRAIPTQPLSVQGLVSVILAAVTEHEGDALVFLPGKREIDDVLECVLGCLAEQGIDQQVLCLPLYGALSKQQQQDALRPAPESKRKIILATNIAETSLTIDGVRIVVDSGLERSVTFSLASTVEKMQTRRISMASADQRAGRAGRTAPGVCYRLWSSEQNARLVKQSEPEICQRDVSDIMLQALSWGASLNDLPLLTQPSEGQLQYAIQVLKALTAIDEQGKLTAHGQAMANFPLDVRLAHMLLTMKGLHPDNSKALWTAACTAYVLSEGERFPSIWMNDIAHSRLVSSNAAKHRIKHFLQLLDVSSKPQELSQMATEWIAQSIALTYPDRVAKRVNDTEYKLANGKRASLASDNTVVQTEWLAVAQLLMTASGKLLITLAHPIEWSCIEALFEAQLKQDEDIVWHASQQRFGLQQSMRLGDIKVNSQPMGAEQIAQAELQQAWQKQIALKGIDWLPFSDAAVQTLNRIRIAKRVCTRQDLAPFPNVDAPSLLASLDSWLLPYVGDVLSYKALSGLDWSQLMLNLLDWQQQQWLDTHLPKRYHMPNGDTLSIAYPVIGDDNEQPIKAPLIAAPMQWFYGFQQSPTIAEGALTLQIELLSPAKRALQKTQDLAAFWGSEAYQQIKKEMKGRYPKHLWPDDPANTAPTKVTKKRMQQNADK
ncbi:ATP-dependent helicase HrpB [Alteromonas facilis]|uniref:ATP-dependent helicase HrpB n=1 Tax=Alteromonas facilis TaxID=2048004 RepID=UPI0013DA43C1|nr:ATP-dependent helicase HrpB [Alteromonas facilis]